MNIRLLFIEVVSSCQKCMNVILFMTDMGDTMEDIYDVRRYNLRGLLKEEIDELRSFWPTKEITDYIYVRFCQLFNYDERWFYAKSEDFRNIIFEKEIDISNVDTSKLICSSFSKALVSALNSLLEGWDNFDKAEVVSDPRILHMSVKVFYKDGTFKIYDPILDWNDFLNAKIGLPIEGISYSDEVSELDRKNRTRCSMESIGYTADYLAVLDELKLSEDSKMLAEDLLDYLIASTDFKGLGMYEINELLNLKCETISGKSLRANGIEYTSVDFWNLISFCFYVNGKCRYREEELAGVEFTKIR